VKRHRRTQRFLAAAVTAALSSHAHAQSPTGDSAKGEPPKEAELKPVTVTDERDRLPSYQPGITSVGKVPQLPRDIPQSVTIVPQSLIRDRNADTFEEALRNVPGITFNAGEGGRIGDNITLRGFSVVGDLYLDGIRDVAQYNRETFNLDRIEVLRGSSSMLYGRGSTGGIVNQASKDPVLVNKGAVAATGGSDRYGRATLDANWRTGENAALRLNAMYTDAGSSREAVRTQRRGIAPAARWGIGMPDELAVSWYHLDYDDIPDYGVPYFQGRPVPVPVTNFYGMARADYQRDRADILTASWNHRFDAKSTFRTVLRSGDYERDLWAVAPRLAPGTTVLDEGTRVLRQRQARGGEERIAASQNDFVLERTAFGMKHLALAGIELVRENADRWNTTGAVANPSTLLFHPDPWVELPAGYFDRTMRTNPVSYVAKTAGLYAQDIAEISPSWKLVLGARWDRFDADYDRAPPAGPLSRLDKVWSWRSGVLYQPDDVQTWYAAYGTSFNPSGELYSLDDRGANTPPERNRNLELGAKWELADGNLSLRAALYRTEKTNERNTDLEVSVEQNLLSGRRHTDGIEVEAAGRITPEWEVFAGVARQRGVIDEATGQQANTLGKVPLNTPPYTASLWTVYRIGSRWRVGGGLEAVGKRYGNNTNTVEAPAYRRWDAMASYTAPSWEVRLNGFNLTDEDIYQGVYQGHVVPGTKRALQLTIEYLF
jgi:catecholate siderophore receptor